MLLLLLINNIKYKKKSHIVIIINFIKNCITIKLINVICETPMGFGRKT